MKRFLYSLLCTLLCVAANAQFDSAPAFPGAEGYGRYTTGGREGTVYHVTTLEDYCDNKDYTVGGTDADKDTAIPGSLRYGIKQSGARIIVFDVAGTIELKAPLKIQNDNITILGQTAPGDGICLKNYTLGIFANNVIVRYIRCRMGNEGRRYWNNGTALTGTDQVFEDDAMNGYQKDDATKKNIIIDHCSISWSVDECASFYGNKEFSLQWCIISESLRNAGHTKGNHGYGGIWGGEKASFHHNLLADHDSRNPRFDHGYVSTLAGPVDYTNNIVYNWNGNSTYGGENKAGYAAKQFNMINNYYKPGNATASSKQNRLLNPTTSCSNCGSGCVPGKFFISGNKVNGNDASISTNNIAFDSGYNLSSFSTNCVLNSKAVSSDRDFSSYNTISNHTADNSYSQVLEYAGASYKRDAVDARVVNDVKNKSTSYTTSNNKGTNGATGGFIDMPSDVGGYPTLTGTKATDTDGDGIPDEWEDAHGLNKNSAADALTKTLDSRGYYTNLEVYANYLVQHITKAERAGATETFTEYYPLDDDPSALFPTTITASTESVSITGTGTATVTLSSNNTEGAYSISSAPNSAVATASINGNTITITGVAAGTTSLTVTQAAGSSHAAGTKTISITVSAAQGATSTIFSLNVTSSSTLSLDYQKSSSIADYATIEGGTATVYNGKNNTAQNMVSGQAVNLGGSSSSYLKIELSDGKKLATGDVITITNAGNWKVSSSDSNSGATTITTPYTVKSTDAIVGKSEIYIFKTGTSGDPSSIKTLTITRGDDSGETPDDDDDTIEDPDPDPVAVKPAAKKAYDFVVGRDGTMDEAIAAANAWTGSGRYLIFVPDGTYNLTGTRQWTLGSDKSAMTGFDGTTVQPGSSFNNNATWLERSNVSIIGQSMLGTKLQNKPNFPGISYTSTLEIRSGKTNTYIQDLTLYNNYANGANDKGVAVAFYDRGTNTIAKNLNAWSNQDTYTSAATRCYYETSKFAGTVDFICGSGDVWFEKCDLIINDRSGNVITAPSTKADELWGYVFNHCTISKAEGATKVTDKNWDLGRPWKEAPASTFLYTKMNVLPKDAAWTNMNDGLAIRFHEYGSTNSFGTLLDLTSRSVSACKGAKADKPVLTEALASKYKVSNVLAGDDNWDPRALTLQTNVTGVQLNGNTLSWDANDYALCWVVFKDGVFYDDVIENSITFSESGTYTVRAANSMGGLGEESAGVPYTDLTGGGAALAFTAAVQGGSNAAGSTLNQETHYYNNWGTSGWAAQAYIGFNVAVPASKQVKSATLKFTSYCGGNYDNRSVDVYLLGKDATTAFDTNNMSLSAAIGTKVSTETDNRTESTKTIELGTDAIAALNNVVTADATSPVIFQLGGAAAGATLYGYASTKAPTLVVEFEDIPTPAVTSITVSPASKTIEVGETLQLSANILPTTANQDVTWSSENTAIAEVDASGKVTAKATGNVKIIATAADSSGKSDFCMVTVIAKQSGGSGNATFYPNDFSSKTGSNTKDGVTLTLKVEGYNDSSHGNTMKCKSDGNTLTFSSDVNITSIVVNCNSQYSTNISKIKATPDIGNIVKSTTNYTYTWTGNAKNIVLTFGLEDGQSDYQSVYVSSIVVITATSPSTPQTITKYISSAEWSSFVPSENVVVPEGVTVYYAKTGSYNGSSVVAVPVEKGQTIAKNTGFFINGSEGNHEFTVSTVDPLNITDNMLSCGANSPIENGSLVFGRNYINDVLTVGFFPLTSYDISLPEGIVYIDGTKLPQYQQAKAISVVFDVEKPTAIMPMQNAEGKVQNYYNLSGQKVNSNYKGIVIINGKKVWKR